MQENQEVSQPDKMQETQKKFSNLSNQIKGWDGHSQRGSAIESAMFEQEMAMEDLLYCDCGNMKDPEESKCWSCS